MWKKTWRNWVSERYIGIQAHQQVEQEKEQAIALLEKQKEVLKKELAAFDFNNTVIDYEGITKLFFENEFIRIQTTAEQHIIRFRDSAELFAFIRNLGFEECTYNFIGYEKWIITTNLAFYVKEDAIPTFDFLHIHENRQATLTLDLSEEVDVPAIKGIIDALHGKFNAVANYEKINQSLMYLVERLNQAMGNSFVMKVDAVDVRAFTFYAENEAGDSYDLRKHGTFDVESLIAKPEVFIEKLITLFTREQKVIKSALESIQRERVRKEKFTHAQQQLKSIKDLNLQVHITDTSQRPTMRCTTLQEPIYLHVDASEQEFRYVSNLNTLMKLLQTEKVTFRTFILDLPIQAEKKQAYSLKEGYIHPSISLIEAKLFIQEAKTHLHQLMQERLTKWMNREHPEVKRVLHRLIIQKDSSISPYSLANGTVSLFINSQQYKKLVQQVQQAIQQLQDFEWSERSQVMPHINQALFGIQIHESKIQNGQGTILTEIVIRKEDGSIYTKYFKESMLIPSSSPLLDTVKKH